MPGPVRAALNRLRARKSMAMKKRVVRKLRLNKPAAKAVRKIVKAELRRENEDKLNSVLTIKTHNSAISGAADCYQLVPSIVEGTQDNQRIGQVVRPKKLKVQFKVQLSQSNYTSAANLTPIKVRLLILKQKNIKAWGQISQFQPSQLLRTNENNSNTELAYTGNVNDDMRMINTDLYDVLLDKKITLTPQYVVFGSGNTEDIKYPILANEVMVTKYIKCPARLTFDDLNGNIPNNFCPFACVGYSYIPPSQGPDVTTTQVTATCLSSLYYEDA